MNVLEPNPALRRIPLVIRLDDGVTLATNAHVSPPAHALQVSVNGAAFVDAVGVFSGDGSGLYWYEAALSEVASQGFLAVKYAATGFRTEIVSQNVGQIFTVGETSGSSLRWPIVIYQDDGTTLATGAATSPPVHYLQTARSGAAFADADGALVEVGSGLYYYQGTVTDSASAASLGIKVARSGFQTAIAWVAVELRVVTVLDAPPVITAITPAPETAPGSVGGMPTAFNVAAATPVEIQITDVNGTSNLFVSVSASFGDGTPDEMIYRAGDFAVGYAARCEQLAITGGLRLIIGRGSGWSSSFGLRVDAIDAAGNAVTAFFFYFMPPRSAAVLPAAPVVDGAINLFEKTRALIVSQLRA